MNVRPSDLLFGAAFNSAVIGAAPYFRFKCTSQDCLTNFNGGELNIQGGFTVPDGGRIRLGGGNRGDADVNVVQFLQGNTETMRIQDGGNVGIGTTSPTAKLHVIGDFIATGTKSAVVATASYGKRQLYAMESPENWFEDFGNAELIQGANHCQTRPYFRGNRECGKRVPHLSDSQRRLRGSICYKSNGDFL